MRPCLSFGEGVLSVHRRTRCATAEATASRTTASASRLRPPTSGWMTVFSLAGTWPSCAPNEKPLELKLNQELAMCC